MPSLAMMGGDFMYEKIKKPFVAMPPNVQQAPNYVYVTEKICPPVMIVLLGLFKEGRHILCRAYMHANITHTVQPISDGKLCLMATPQVTVYVNVVCA